MALRVDDPLLIAWICDALPPPRMLEVADAVLADPMLQLRVTELRQELEQPPKPLRWAIPPPRVETGFSLRPAARLTLSRRLRPGGRFRVVLQPTEAQLSWHLVVLRWNEGWSVRHPHAPEELTPASALPEEEDGRVLELAADPDAGTQRWAVALLPPEVPVAWTEEDPWAALRDALLAGTVPVRAVDIEVVER